MNKKLLSLAVLLALVVVVLAVLASVMNRQPAVQPGGERPEKQLVQGFPEFPLMENTNLETSEKLSGQDGYKAMWYTQASPEEVSDWYQDALFEQEWAIVEKPMEYSEEWEATYIIKAQKGGMMATVTAVSLDDDDDTEVYVEIVGN